MNTFLAFQEFTNADDANEMAEKLSQHGIANAIEKNSNLLGEEIIGRQYNNHIVLKIKGEDFAKARKILIENTTVDMNMIDRNYMLFSLSDNELIEVLAKPDEWGAYNYNLAKMILAERGTNVSEQKIDSMQKEYANTLYQQRSIDSIWLVLGYTFSIAGIWAGLFSRSSLILIYGLLDAIPGCLGIILGLVIVRTKRVLPDGQQIMSYDDRARKHGKAMLYLGIFALALNAFLFLIRYEFPLIPPRL